MLQRVQSVFLLAASAAVFMIFFFPVWEARFVVIETVPIEFFVRDYLLISVIAAIAGVISFASIFAFSKRKLQIKACWLVAVFMAVIYGLIGYHTFEMDNPLSSMFTISPGIGAYMPIIALILSLLAIRWIKADERLVRSSGQFR